MRHHHTLLIDSEDRQPWSTAGQASFELSETIVHPTSFSVRSVTLMNTLPNVRPHLNGEYLVSNDGGATFSTVSISGISHFYTPADYTTLWNTVLTIAGHGTATYDATTNYITLTVNAGFILKSPSRRGPLGFDLDKLYTSTNGNGAGGVHLIDVTFLDHPFLVGFYSPSFSSNAVFSNTTQKRKPFYTMNLTHGYGSIEVEQRGNNANIIYFKGPVSLSNLDITVFDPHTGDLLNELARWAMTIDIII